MTISTFGGTATLKKHLHYNPETGVFIWKIRPSYNMRAGDVAGGFAGGYWLIRFFGKLYKAHRLAWFYTYNEWPDQIDHINRDGCDNRLCNLRSVSNQQNARNSTVYGHNKLGIKGVVKRGVKYAAYIGHDGTKHWLGTYLTLAEADAARKAAELKLWSEL